jgi:hypothetical protein
MSPSTRAAGDLQGRAVVALPALALAAIAAGFGMRIVSSKRR